MHKNHIGDILAATNPSLVIQYLRNTRKLDSEIENLINVPQDSLHHPEGDVYVHTMMVLEAAAEISRRENLNPFDNAVLRLAALTHDFGKVTHTQITDGKITAHGHPEAGVAPAFAFLRRSLVNEEIILHVVRMVQYHMIHIGFYTPDVTSKSVRKMVTKVAPSNLKMLAYVIEADMSGRGGKWYNQGLPQRMKDILIVAATLNNPVDVYPEPLVSGDDIMEVTGIQPSPLLGKIKAALYRAQLEGKFSTRAEGMMLLLNHVVIVDGLNIE